ncbi:MAG TPA: D-aminoacyl-tRNA deacylase [Pyrinomonadaceae bacterium]|jgi:D-tyrosyl-tRNA(Tyr) deacylase|nr:D-aminoacyl-tRNA deacylase [Pyrinomonadaceae bacterium]
MRLVIQRVTFAAVDVEGVRIAEIDKGLLILVGITQDDDDRIAFQLAEKCVNLRIFSDENENMNLSLRDVNGKILAVSQFTLYADCRRGRRPSFIKAARPEVAEKIYLSFVKSLRGLGVEVETGKFGAMMKVSLCNDGPVTIFLDSDELKNSANG